MRKWEETYQKYAEENELDNRLAELEEQLNRRLETKEEGKMTPEEYKEQRSITPKEYKEYKKLKAIKENLPKVKNILEYREKLEKQLEVINAEIDRRKDNVKEIMEENKKRQELDEKLVPLMQEQESLNNKISDLHAKHPKGIKKGSKEEQELEGLKEKLNKVHAEIDENNRLFSPTLTEKEEKEKKEKEEKENKEYMKEKYRVLRGKSYKELKAEKINISTKISKCNMICNNLLKGYSWDSIDMQLEKWQDTKLTSSKATADKIREASRVNTSEREPERNPEIIPEREPEGNPEIVPEREPERREILPDNVSEFDKKHPRIAAIKRKLQQVGKKIKNAVIGNKISEVLEEEATPHSGEPRDSEEPRDSGESREDNEFRNYIKVVAEKGYKQADKERLQEMKNRSHNSREEEETR